jgi:hypothetical protein
VCRVRVGWLQSESSVSTKGSSAAFEFHMSVLENIDSPIADREQSRDIVSSLVEETKRNERRQERGQRDMDDRRRDGSRSHRRRDASEETEELRRVHDSEYEEDRRRRDSDDDRPRIRERERDRTRSRDMSESGAADGHSERVNVTRERPRSPLSRDLPIDRRREAGDGSERRSRRHNGDDTGDVEFSGASSRGRREDSDEPIRGPAGGRPPLPRDADVGGSVGGERVSGPPGDTHHPRPPRVSASQELLKSQTAPVLRARDAEVRVCLSPGVLCVLFV